ncbi:MAG: response regulator transcription factor [Myxococcota bacterium]
MARIIVVEDDAAILKMEERILSAAGHEVMCFRDGASALEEARGSPPDLVILDVMMAGLSGFEVARLLRAEPGTALVPVIFVTARNEARSMNEGFKAGGSAYLTKPFSGNRLLALVNKLSEVGQAEEGTG